MHMKKLVIIMLITICGQMVCKEGTIHCDNPKSKKSVDKIKHDKVIKDSLWKVAKVFMDTTFKYLCKDKVTQKDIDNYLTYAYKHMQDSIQISHGFSLPIVKKDEAIEFMRKELSDLVEKKTKFQFDGWDGYDGTSPYTGIDFNILYRGNTNQFLVVLNTKSGISHLSSQHLYQ